MVALCLATACMWQIPLAGPEVDARYKSLAPASGKALLYLIRPPQPGEGDPIGTRILLDGRGFGTVKGGAYLAAMLPPGQHTLSVSLHNRAEIVLQLVPGRTYYVAQGLRWREGKFFVWLKRLKPAQGRKMLEQCRYALKNEFDASLR